MGDSQILVPDEADPPAAIFLVLVHSTVVQPVTHRRLRDADGLSGAALYHSFRALSGSLRAIHLIVS